MGGVDLLAKAEEQEKLLQESNNELEERRRRAEQLRKELEEKEVKIDKTKKKTVGYSQKIPQNIQTANYIKIDQLTTIGVNRCVLRW